MRTLAKNAAITALTALGADAMARRRTQHAMVAAKTAYIRVAMMHASDAASDDAFRTQLLWVKERFDLIDFETFKRLWQDKAASAKLTRPAVLITFDDGLASNYEIAAPLLEEMGTRGVFFVVPDFARREGADARTFFETRIKGPIERGWQPMSSHQVRELSDRGHTIGNHTFSHSRLSDIAPADYHREIEQSADALQEMIGKRVDAFAWTSYYTAITAQAHELICRRHDFCFSPCPGLNDVSIDSPKLIWRTNVEPFYAPAQYRFMYSGLVDRSWAPRRRELAQMLKL